MKSKILFTIMFCLVLTITAKETNKLKGEFTMGNPEIKSIKAIAFGPDNILFIGDNTGSMVYAIEINDKKNTSKINFNIDNITAKIGAIMGAAASDIKIEDMVVNPVSKNVFFAITRENKGKTQSALFKLGDNGLQEYALEGVNYSKVAIPNAPEKEAKVWERASRTWTLTDLQYVNGQVIISGLSNEEFSSALRTVQFPFNAEMITTNVQAYHVSHGQNETNSPVYRFLPVKSGNEWNIIAGYSCSPLVIFKMNQLNGNKKLIGKTVAELGGGNAPTGIISYRHNNEDYILVGNNRYSLTKFTGKDLFNAKAIQSPSREAGVKRETIKIGSVAHLADYGENVLVITRSSDKKVFTLKKLSKDNI